MAIQKFYYEVTFEINLYKHKNEVENNSTNIIELPIPFKYSNTFRYTKKIDPGKIIKCKIAGVDGEYNISIICNYIKKGVVFEEGIIDSNTSYTINIIRIFKKLYLPRY